MQTVTVQIKRMPDTDDLPLPRYMTAEAAGMDLHAAVRESLELAPGQRALVPTGCAIALPAGIEAQIRPRSGLAIRHGISLLNAPGTIDADYRGEIKVIMVNLGETAFIINRGDRIAQMVLAPVLQALWHVVPALPETERDAGGFGHTGT